MEGFKNVWSAITAIPRAICSIVRWLWQLVEKVFAAIKSGLDWFWGNLSEFFAAFHSVFRLERLFWSLIYAVLGVGGYTVYTWIVTFTSGMDWAIRVIKE